MAYEIIRTKEFGNIENDEPLKLLKYAILKKEDKYYVQLKLKNDSNFCISRFKFNYKTIEGREVYTSPKLKANPNDIFFDRNLIEIPSEKFLFLGFESVFAKKEKANKKQNIKLSITNFIKNNKNIIIISVLVGILIFSIINIISYSIPYQFLHFGFSSLLLNFSLIIVVTISIFIYLSIINKTKLSNEERKKKDLTTWILWISILGWSALFLFVGLLYGFFFYGLILLLIILAVLTVVIFIYLKKKSNYRKEHILIERKYVLFNVIPMTLFVFIKLLFVYQMLLWL